MIWPKSTPQQLLGELYAFNLTEDQLRQRFIEPYDHDRPITSAGRTIPAGDVNYIRVGETDQPFDERSVRAAYTELEAFQQARQVTDDWITGPAGAAALAEPPAKSSDPVDIAVALCRRFEYVSRQLLRRHQDRTTLTITDEYDVQDLMHALLLVEFRDVRAESWTPTYLGKGSRTDFLVPEGGFVLEVKKTRPTLVDRHVGSELAEDITRYSDPKANRGAHTLICFVHDPDRLLVNSIGLENDLGDASNERLKVVGVVG
jgi:hypothetical protein